MRSIKTRKNLRKPWDINISKRVKINYLRKILYKKINQRKWFKKRQNLKTNKIIKLHKTRKTNKIDKLKKC